MNPLRLELYTTIHQRQFNELLSREQDKVTSFRNRVFLANTIRETGVTESIKKRFNANGELSNCLRHAGLESYGNTLTRDQVANAIIGNEVIHNFGEFLSGFCDGIGRIYQSAWRWIQSLIDNSDEKIKEINNLMSTASNNLDRAGDAKIVAYDLSQIAKKYANLNTAEIRETACRYLVSLKQFNSMRFYQGKDGQTLRSYIRNLKKLQNDVISIEEAVYYAPKKEFTAREVYKQAQQIQPTVVDALKNIITTNNKYQGFWKTGFDAGKFDALLSAIPGGMIAAAALLNEVRGAAVNSWNAISESCSLDNDIANALINNLKTITSVK